MIKIAFIVPYPELEDAIEEALDGYPYKDEISVSNYLFQAPSTKKMQFDSEVVVARGLAAHHFNEKSEVPVIEIPITGYDVIRAVEECKVKYNPGKIAIIGTTNIVYGADSIDSLVDLDIKCYEVEDDDAVEGVVERAILEGADAIIGGVSVFQVASSKKINSIFIKSGKSAIRLALDESYRAALITRQERAKAEQLRTIVHYSYEGIIAVDKNGFVTVFNKAAQKLLKTKSDEVIGRYVEEVLPSTRLHRVVETGKEETGELQHLHDVLMTINRIPIKVGNEIVGAIATLQDVTRISQIEERIRRKTHPKGLNAKYSMDDIIGTSSKIQSTKERAKKFSQVNSNVLIIGETGTGKEIFAQSIHNLSKRRGGPFVAINCAALPENLLESELFGYVEGAFTGARKGGKPGLFELAHNGSIFLDEISELDLGLQGRLLRVLQEQEIMRLGHDQVIPINVRVIAASNKDLKDQVNKGLFREDLMYRIDVLRLSIPSLRERKDDIPLLVEHFIKKYSNKFDKEIKGLDFSAKNMLMMAEWQGNIRELENVCERLVVLSDDDIIKEWDIKSVIEQGDIALDPRKTSNQHLVAKPTPSFENEKEMIAKTIEECGNNKAEAARILGMNRTTLWRKIKKYNL